MARSVRPALSITPGTLQRVYNEPGAVTEYQLQNVLILVWFGQPSAEVITRLELANESVRQRAPHGMAMIHIVYAPLKLPDEFARTAMLRFMRTHNMRVVAMIVTQTGFVLSMLRSVVTSLRVVTGGRFDYRICATIEEVSEWLPPENREKTGVEVEPERLAAALREATADAPAPLASSQAP